MVVSAEALAALGALEHGARFNVMHTVARELMGAGLACEEWGHLGITENGRRYLRKGRFTVAVTNDDNVSDIYNIDISNIDRMAAPHLINKKAEPLILEEAPSPPLPIAETRLQEMQRAAGVASGATNEWPSAKWIEEFIRALDAPR